MRDCNPAASSTLLTPSAPKPLAHPHPAVLHLFPHTTQAPTLNAIAPQTPDPAQAAHRAANLAACLELRDLGLALARAAAARGLAAQNQTHPTAEPAPATEPPTPQPTQAKPNEADLAFARHSRSVRQSVELWEKITNNTFARRAQSPHPWSEPHYPDLDLDLDDTLDEDDPPYSEADRFVLHEAVANLALTAPTHAEIPETLTTTIEQTLTAHPNDHLSTNFTRICEIFALTPDRTRLQPHLESQLRPPPSRYPQLE